MLASVCLRLSDSVWLPSWRCRWHLYITDLLHCNFTTFSCGVLAEVPYKTFGRMLKDYLVFSIQAGPTPARIVVLRAVRFVLWK